MFEISNAQLDIVLQTYPLGEPIQWMCRECDVFFGEHGAIMYHSQGRIHYIDLNGYLSETELLTLLLQ